MFDPDTGEQLSVSNPMMHVTFFCGALLYKLHYIPISCLLILLYLKQHVRTCSGVAVKIIMGNSGKLSRGGKLRHSHIQHC